ncbi:PLP-dependent aminotransferase family protein [Fictibacillus aquaticus]|uniref:GntR family transcriptional regulator n=1 Tax=Fictibacillus aquaticus TaxID=2021314 RepID=A0A235F5J7_9BACL|nr:PLP-dependent aminotransferase family protein [Fictibacillus aquaticus]OYD56540.1 GntR family transcriptional regulator [Fictibacillus aquaticus]
MKNPLFIKVHETINNRLERGEYKPGEKLPSIRSLATELNVHRLTVFKAYQLLKENGKVEVKDKSGYYAKGESSILTDLDYPIVTSYIHKSHLSEIHRVHVEFQFSQAVIDPDLLPNQYTSSSAKKVLDLYPKVLSTYSTVQGDRELRESLANYFYEKQKQYITADDVLITTGSQQAIDLIARTFVRNGDHVLIERPTYSPAIDMFRELGARLLPVNITPDGYDMEQLEQFMKEKKPVLFYLNPTFQNPTGYTVPDNQRKQLANLAEKYRVFILEDDPFRDIYFEKKPPLPLFTYDVHGYCLYVRSFSKYIAPGLRISAILCRQPLMEQLLASKSLADNGTPLLNQKMFLHYYASERLQKHIEKLRIALELRKAAMESALEGEDFYWETPDGGLNLWVQIPDSIRMEELLAACLEQSLSFVPGTICDPLKEKENWIRLSYSYLNEKKIVKGIQLFKDILSSLK